MSTARRRRRTINSNIVDVSVESDEDAVDSCPLLGEEEASRNDNQTLRICDVRRVDNGAPGTKKNFVQRIRSRKNRLVQRVLVACRLAEPSRDLAFKSEQVGNKAVMEQLSAIRYSLVAHSQSIVNMSTALCCFTGNSSRSLHDDSVDVLANVAAEGHKIREHSLVFSNLVEKSVLAKIDRRMTEFEHIDSLIAERAKLVLEADYAKRKLLLEQQHGKANRIADRKHALEAAQLDCERATRVIADQLSFVQPKQDTEFLELFREYALLVAQFFTRGAKLVEDTAISQ
ncbi:hypothetical protein PHYBOEH_005267 [Phytophthora boehmeriae]|uniref:BAR domain-containing protein n=1 Tax=Phytophthora boehmeriae TaxID=109152 RepID=A0A8T1WMD1_9STRA|nr:hypothetical protein PHYBOEH_005267 [Phytophthora boehmeriae]